MQTIARPIRFADQISVSGPVQRTLNVRNLYVSGNWSNSNLLRTFESLCFFNVKSMAYRLISLSEHLIKDFLLERYFLRWQWGQQQRAYRWRLNVTELIHERVPLPSKSVINLSLIFAADSSSEEVSLVSDLPISELVLRTEMPNQAINGTKLAQGNVEFQVMFYCPFISTVNDFPFKNYN
jgi:hypothetical protein